MARGLPGGGHRSHARLLGVFPGWRRRTDGHRRAHHDQWGVSALLGAGSGRDIGQSWLHRHQGAQAALRRRHQSGPLQPTGGVPGPRRRDPRRAQRLPPLRLHLRPRRPRGASTLEAACPAGLGRSLRARIAGGHGRIRRSGGQRRRQGPPAHPVPGRHALCRRAQFPQALCGRRAAPSRLRR